MSPSSPRPRHALAPLGRALAGALAPLVAVALALDMQRIERAAGEAYGEAGLRALRAWQQMLAEARPLPETERLQRVNDFFNTRIRFADDEAIWGRSDYWATPLQTLGRGEGDCEDFTIAKYFSLVETGLPASRLRLTYVKARVGGAQGRLAQAHMVLIYYPTLEADPLVLDNLVADIRPAERRPDLTPVFGFNSESLWLAGERSAAGGATARLSRWRELIERMRKEGFE